MEEKKLQEVGASAAQLGALDNIFTENVALFHRLRVVAELIHGQGEFSGGRRTILKNLERFGPVSVPQMARQKAVSRQAVQKFINELAQEGLVEFIGNLAHKRSPLVRLTAKGQEYVNAMNEAEARLLGCLKIDISAEILQATAQTLKEVRLLLESQQGLFEPPASSENEQD